MDPTISLYLSQAIHGFAYGMILFLIASGLTLIFGMMGILNLAHASIFMLSGYICYQTILFTGSYWIALIVAPIITAFVGVLIERLLLRRLQEFGHVEQLILTMGISLFILGAVQLIWGTESIPVLTPPILEGLVDVFGFTYPIYRLFIIVLAVTVLSIMGLILFKTRIGKIVRAAVEDREMVNAIGINIPLVFTCVFGFGTWLAGIAGVVVAPILTIFPGLADQVGMDAFIVVVTAGFGSLGGAFIVSIIFGLLNSYGVQIISQLAPILMFGFMAIVLSIRPEGMFGVKE
jgi:branched-chain amino acid transport system permease protein